ncbi:hypothetical protein A3G55_02670 [Candidatus Giovannonibacteria bacterium RIFCSPLOWO2_12_FULL_44_25]|uniref:Uncharacterized protein n=3 Tax=Candidatus Giovannoniibacteriota TaxID=1752738 RepID=A0A0G1IE01_9BACT|nr:MAG: hypothetical protein UW15_C0015G0003 [Parcubacteria group bacterium GW2011_GWC1_44_10]KKT57053.1 MAG: hypothetical protein UW49_C0008G0015 [Candidatus Giovannonibacteria bacterium GW2011_GWB1_44_23]KKT59490.1 MAG: hypothetical protein UW53_C0011G0019 [Candidatus Giovannonibacteria bacterium GW2011_GWA1_44_25]OGF49940.1 MAG: hypothetical protein A2120_04495 [Candidatus Giovannonibacteria bacterium GWA2_45_15]OGF60574.1 MAG: hypothetical protein A2656_00655 [Candidatus Giovannonibacteria 
MTKKHFCVVADLNTHKVVKVLEGPIEYERLFKKRRALIKQYPDQNYDVIIVREINYKRLKFVFPELYGWENITPKPF